MLPIQDLARPATTKPGEHHVNIRETTRSQPPQRRALHRTQIRPGQTRRQQKCHQTRHLFPTTVLFNEEQEEYNSHLQDFIDRFQPQDRVELRLVQRMADCEWRLARARYIETTTIDLQIDETAELVQKRFDSVDEPVRVAFALQLLDNGQYAIYNGVQRQETRLHRQYERSYKLLMDMRKNAPTKNTSRNEPIFTATASTQATR